MKELIPLALFAMVYGIIDLSYKHRERKMCIDRGLPLIEENKSKTTNWLVSFKWGVFLVAIGLGLFLADVLSRNGEILSRDWAFISLPLFLGGLALLVSAIAEGSVAKHQQNAKPDKQGKDEKLTINE